MLSVASVARGRAEVYWFEDGLEDDPHTIVIFIEVGMDMVCRYKGLIEYGGPRPGSSVYSSSDS